MVFKSILAVIVFIGSVSVAHAQAELSGIYTVRQESTNRLLDAHEINQKDWAVVTRAPQNNLTQRWIFINVGGSVYTIQQQSNGRYLDAYLTENNDFAVVSRKAQNNGTQRWIVTPIGHGTYRIQHESNKRHLDAYQDEAKDFRAVTRPAQPNNLTQVWSIRRVN